MNIVQTPIFKRTYKKLHNNEKLACNNAITAIAENPEIGEEKKQDLAGIRVYKYKLNEKIYLLSYSYDPKTLRLIMLGFHENFYRDLKDYLKG